MFQRGVFSRNQLFRVDWHELGTLLRLVVKWLLLCAGVAGLSGSAAALFLLGVAAVNKAWAQHWWLIWLLPVFGTVTGWVYYRWGGVSGRGMAVILSEMDTPREPLPVRMCFLSAWGTLMTLLGGGSVGVEATGVQMAAGLADGFGRAVGVSKADRPVLLASAIAAGFSALFGTPVAGALFAIEVPRRGRPHHNALLPALLSSFLAERVATQGWQVARPAYVTAAFPDMHLGIWLKCVIAGGAFALAARAFSAAVHRTKGLVARRVTYAPFRPALGGMIIILLSLMWPSGVYNGLGTPTVQHALLGEHVAPMAFALKILFTAVTLGFGFIGGEVTPLFFIGAALGNVLAPALHLPREFLAATGFVGVFAGATHAPLAGVFLGLELFGGQSLVYTATACIVSHVVTGSQGIYSEGCSEQLVDDMETPAHHA